MPLVIAICPAMGVGHQLKVCTDSWPEWIRMVNCFLYPFMADVRLRLQDRPFQALPNGW